MKSNPCTDYLTDIEYLEHMIPHHQVAIDMSYLLIPHTNNPIILNLCRNIIRVQEYEIWEMNFMKNSLPSDLFMNDIVNDSNELTKLDLYEKNDSKSDEECDPLFFDPDDHMKHMEHMEINDVSYLKHMIPHHQVAIDMSKRLLRYTNNSYLLQFCKNLIIEQQGEILYMNKLLKSNYQDSSILL